MSFDDQHSALALGEMQREFQRIMRPSGLKFEWRFLDHSIPRHSFPHLVVARFHGSCRSIGREKLESDPRTLGVTHVSDGEVLPFSEVDCDKIRRLVRGLIDGENFSRMELLYGRALGRVLAHEIYHMLAETKEHGSAGVTRRTLTSHELVRGSLELHESEARLIRNKFRRRPNEGLIATGGR